jgi:hypothetical protein
VFVLAAVFACKINTDPNQAVAIEIVLPDSGRVEVTDTFRPSGRALNGIGDSVQAQLYWSSLDTTLAVLDSATGVSIAKTLGPARLQARTGRLFSNPEAVTILGRLDSLRALGASRDTVFVTPVPPNTLADSVSDSLRVQAYAFGAIPAARRVVYAFTIFPDSGSVVTLVPKDTVLTSASGVAAVRVQLHQGGPVPDSVVVTATMRHLNGTLVPDTVTFVVEFRQ